MTATDEQRADDVFPPPGFHLTWATFRPPGTLRGVHLRVCVSWWLNCALIRGRRRGLVSRSADGEGGVRGDGGAGATDEDHGGSGAAQNSHQYFGAPQPSVSTQMLYEDRSVLQGP